MSIKNVLIFSLIGLLLLVGSAAAVTEINSGTTFPYTMSTAGETYILTENISTPAGALIVGANGAILDGQNHTITYASESSAIGIDVSNYNDATIKNINVIAGGASSYGLIIRRADYCNVENCNVSTSNGIALYVYTADHNNITGCIGNSTGNNGILVHNSSAYNTLRNCSGISDTSYGFVVQDSANNNTFTNCSGESSTKYGLITIGGSNDNDFAGCRGNGSIRGMYVYQSYNNNYVSCNGTTYDGYGLYIASADNNTFSFCVGESTNSSVGLLLNNADGNVFQSCVGKSAHSSGTKINDSDFNEFESCTHQSTNGHGISIEESSDNNVFTEDTCISPNGLGFFLAQRCIDNTFSGITVNSAMANTEIPDGANHLLLIGDSITYGWYGEYTNDTLGNSWYCSNGGVGGDWAEQCVNRIPQMLEVYNPDYVSIMLGTNDISNGRAQQDIIDDVLEISNYVASCNATPIILLVTPRATFNPTVVSYNQALEIQARAAGFRVINTYDSLDSDPQNGAYNDYVASYYRDGLHPVDEGNRLIGNFTGVNILSMFNIYHGLDMSYSINSNGLIIASRDVYPTDVQIPFTVIPSDGAVNVTISTWTQTQKTWTESATGDISVNHTIGGFSANTVIAINRDNISYDSALSDSTGNITWIYDEGFSEHEFTATPCYMASHVSGSAPLSIKFTNMSENATSWYWDFENDGKIDSTKQNPVHTYGQAGNYSVNLTVQNEYGNFSTVKTDYITVSAQTPPSTLSELYWWLRGYLGLLLTFQAVVS